MPSTMPQRAARNIDHHGVHAQPHRWRAAPHTLLDASSDGTMLIAERFGMMQCAREEAAPIGTKVVERIALR
jgi:hypothetical protein